MSLRDIDILLTNVRQILEVQIPFTYYVFQTYNNTFTLQENAGGPATVTIPVGNYTAAQMATQLAASLNAVSPNSYVYSATFSSITQKFTITNNDAGHHTFTLSFGTGPGDLANDNPRGFLGFLGGANSSVNVGGVSTLVAPYAALVTGPNYLYLNSTKFGSNVQMYLPAGATNLGNGTIGPQVAKIPINVNPGGIIYWSDPDPQKWFDCENLFNVTSFDFYITLGNTNQIVTLNGNSFSIKLGVLVNKMVHNDVLGGGSHNDRIFQRCVPRGMFM